MSVQTVPIRVNWTVERIKQRALCVLIQVQRKEKAKNSLSGARSGVVLPMAKRGTLPLVLSIGH
jgi:hypothetical protein